MNTPPSIAELTARFLAARDAADAECRPGVEPYEVASGFRTDAKAAWADAVAAVGLCGASEKLPAAPAEWANVVRQTPPAVLLPMAVGHFPQQVRDVSALLGTLSATPAAAVPAPAGVSKTAAGGLVAAAFARLAGDHAAAERTLARPAADAALEALRANELGVLRWQQGDIAQAVALWKQHRTPPALFNLGVAHLAQGNLADARECFRAAIDLLPESSGWRQLAELYAARTSIQ